MEDPNSLDINFHVPLTRSSPQELINSTSYKEVPVEANECMLNALLKIAVINGIPVYQRYINSTYTAKQAYYAVRDSAIKYSQNSSLYEKPYGGGAMTPKLGAEVGEKSNILHGNLIKISNFNELYRLLSNPEWQYDRKCVINFTYKGESHSSICYGIKNDYIKIYSTQNGNERMYSTNQYTNISIIY